MREWRRKGPAAVSVHDTGTHHRHPSLSLSLSALKAAGAGGGGGGGGGVGGNVPAEMIGKPPSKVTPITDRNDPFAGKTGKPKRPKGRKINKADIGLPSDFR